MVTCDICFHLAVTSEVKHCRHVISGTRSVYYFWQLYSPVVGPSGTPLMFTMHPLPFQCTPSLTLGQQRGRWFASHHVVLHKYSTRVDYIG